MRILVQKIKKALIILFLIPFSLSAQEFNLARFIERNYDILADSAIWRVALDSLKPEFSEEFELEGGWYFGGCYPSDDRLMKIYHFAGEGCGVYCNPFYQSILAISDSPGYPVQFQETEELDFNLDSIITLVKGKEYLIFGNHSGRPRGIESVWGKNVLHCSIESGFQVIWSF